MLLTAAMLHSYSTFPSLTKFASIANCKGCFCFYDRKNIPTRIISSMNSLYIYSGTSIIRTSRGPTDLFELEKFLNYRSFSFKMIKTSKFPKSPKSKQWVIDVRGQFGVTVISRQVKLLQGCSLLFSKTKTKKVYNLKKKDFAAFYWL